MPINKKTFCVAPWFSVYINSDKSLAPCCKFKTLKKYANIDEYFTSRELQKVRQDLIDGVQNKNCQSCWNSEANGGDSLRLSSNRTIANKNNIKIADQIENPKLSNVVSFDLTLGNLCNLKCVMCNPELSSQLLAEANSNNELKKIYSAQTNYDQKYFNWPSDYTFIKWCEKYLPQAVHIKFTGGEPFIIPWIDQVIQRIPDEQKKKCILHFTSNLTVINESLFQHFHKFKEVWISVSVEGTDTTFEYLRHGHKWQKIKDNITIIKNKNIKNLILRINHVVQAPSFHSILAMVEYFDLLKIQINPILLTTPRHFTLSALTKRSKQKFLENTINYNGVNFNFIKFVRSITKKNIEQDTVLTDKMVNHFRALDKVRSNSFADVIPVENLEQ